MTRRKGQMTLPEFIEYMAKQPSGRWLPLDPRSLDAESRRALGGTYPDRINRYEKLSSRDLATDGSEVLNEALHDILLAAGEDKKKIPKYFKQRIERARELGVLDGTGEVPNTLTSIATVRGIFAHDTTLQQFEWEPSVVHEIKKGGYNVSTLSLRENFFFMLFGCAGILDSIRKKLTKPEHE